MKLPEARFATAGEMKEALIQSAAAPAAPAPAAKPDQDVAPGAPPTERPTQQEGGWLKKRLRWPWGLRQLRDRP